MKALLITGKHRSGTSALARQCAELGFSFGKNLFPSQSDNPKGFYEDVELLRSMNNRLRRSSADGTHPWHWPMRFGCSPSIIQLHSNGATGLAR